MSNSWWLCSLAVVACFAGLYPSLGRAQEKPKIQELTSGEHDATPEKAVEWLNGRGASGLTSAGGRDASRAEQLWLGHRQCASCHFQVPVQTATDACTRDSQPTGAEAYLGVALARVPEVLRQHIKLASSMGLLVEAIDAGSPADQAGLEQYDIVEQIDGQWLVNPEQFAVLMRFFAPGSQLSLTTVKQGETRTMSVRLAERPRWNGELSFHAANYGASWQATNVAGQAAWPGVQVVVPPAALVKQLKLSRGMGLLVDRISASSPAQAAGIKRHDLLQKLDDQWLINEAQLRALIRQRQPGQHVQLTLLRDGQPMVVEAELRQGQSNGDQVSGALEQWKQSFLARWTSDETSDAAFLTRLYDEALGEPPTADELRRFLDQSSSAKRAAAVDTLLTDPQVVSRLSGEAAAQWVDPMHRISLYRLDGRLILRAETAQGEKLFDGPVDTLAQRNAVPESVRTKLAALQSRLTAATVAEARDGAGARGVDDQLNQVLRKVEFQLVTLPQAIERLRAETSANLVLNARALRDAGADLDKPFSLSLADARLSTVLKTLLALVSSDKPLTYCVQDEVILLTAESEGVPVSFRD
jgi:hypothetical protein